MLLGSRLLTAIAGAVLLLAGRRVYWLLVGLVGFVVGFSVSHELIQGSEWVTLAVGLVAGLLAGGLAVFFQKVALAVAGFLIGGLAVLWWAEKMAWGESLWVWGAALAAAILGSILLRTVFEAALVVLSSVFGATLLLEAIERPVDELSLLFLGLVTSGIVVQSVFGRARKSE